MSAYSCETSGDKSIDNETPGDKSIDETSGDKSDETSGDKSIDETPREDQFHEFALCIIRDNNASVRLLHKISQLNQYYHWITKMALCRKKRIYNKYLVRFKRAVHYKLLRHPIHYVQHRTLFLDLPEMIDNDGLLPLSHPLTEQLPTMAIQNVIIVLRRPLSAACEIEIAGSVYRRNSSCQLSSSPSIIDLFADCPVNNPMVIESPNTPLAIAKRDFKLRIGTHMECSETGMILNHRVIDGKWRVCHDVFWAIDNVEKIILNVSFAEAGHWDGKWCKLHPAYFSLYQL